MPYKLSGVLKSPNGQPLTGVDIQFIAQQTQSPVLQQTDHNIRLGLDGAYNVTLENNTYAVKAQINGLGPQHMGYILISSDTTAGLDLPQLLRSYSQQSTAPDYAQMIEKWLAEAKAAADTSTAQAASAKSQADRAKNEADRASQISGLDTVADAVGLAAVPFPDVWIPFNDSLRMFAGYGREVKVGDDVVARMVNFERSTTATYIDKSGVLRTAAINEPRFEKQGLLIEGQSTNLWPRSEGESQLFGCTNTTPITSAGWNMRRYSANSGAGASDVSVSGDGKYTVSVSFLITGVPAKFTFQTRNGTVFTSWFGIDETGNVISNPTTKFSNLTSVRFGDVVRVSATTPDLAGVTTIRFFREQVDGDTFGGIQLEALPFASSYIPTNGAAVTRGADKCWIPAAGNIPLNLNSMTQSASIDILGKGLSSWPRLVELNHPADRGALVSMIDGTWGGASLTVSITGNSMISTVAVARYEDVKLFNDGRAGTTFSRYQSIDAGGIVYIAGYPAVATRWFFGHIRNLRIWHHALSDAQIKGLK